MVTADLAGEVPNTPATLFEVASVTKQFTAAAVMRLVDRGKVELDDPISEYLPGIPENCRAITVRHLLQHTSGIPGSNSAGGGTDLAVVLPSFLRGGPRHEPGTHWEYWNQGYALLSEVIARASGKSYVEYLRDQLFKRAKMSSTCFTGDAPPKGATVAIGRSTRGPLRRVRLPVPGDGRGRHEPVGPVAVAQGPRREAPEARVGARALQARTQRLRPGLVREEGARPA